MNDKTPNPPASSPCQAPPGYWDQEATEESPLGQVQEGAVCDLIQDRFGPAKAPEAGAG